MLKQRNLSDSALPYGTLIAQLVHRFKVPHETEVTETVKPDGEFQDKHLHQMRYVKRDGVWVEKGQAKAKGEAEAEEQEIEALEAVGAQPGLLSQILEEIRSTKAAVGNNAEASRMLREEMNQRFDNLSIRLNELGAPTVEESDEDSDQDG